MSGAPPEAGQVWNAAGYEANASFVAELAGDAVALLDPTPGEAILDLGCGDGRLTAALADAGSAVIGLEPDPSLAQAARGRGLEVLEQDAHAPFGVARFDAVFSNAALHWMRAPETVIANVFAALRPGGRLVAEQGGFGNVAAIVAALHASLEATGNGARIASPWDFPSVTTQTARLEAAGFEVTHAVLVPRPTPLSTGMAGWLDTFAGPYLAGLAPDSRQAVLDDTLRRLEPVLRDPAEGWKADYVRLRFRAVRPGP